MLNQSIKQILGFRGISTSLMRSLLTGQLKQRSLSNFFKVFKVNAMFCLHPTNPVRECGLEEQGEIAPTRDKIHLSACPCNGISGIKKTFYTSIFSIFVIQLMPPTTDRYWIGNNLYFGKKNVNCDLKREYA